jgi:hypothetical protein
VLTTAGARALGLSRSAVRHRVARRGWQPLVPGVVLTVAEPPTRTDWALVGIELAGPAGAVSGWDAVRLHGLGSATPPSDDVLVLDRCGHNRRAGPVRIRPTDRDFAAAPLPADHPVLAFVRVVDIARAVADTALDHRTLAPVRALVTSTIQRGLCPPDALVEQLRHCPRNGSAFLRRALADVLEGARSIAEAEAIQFLRRAAVPPFEANVPIVTQDGRLVAVADLLWRELRAIAEIDSREFHFEERDWKATSRRHNRLTAAGLAVAHFPPSEIRTRRGDWARDVESWLRARARELQVPFRPRAVAVRPGPDGPPPFVLPF